MQIVKNNKSVRLKLLNIVWKYFDKSETLLLVSK